MPTADSGAFGYGTFDHFRFGMGAPLIEEVTETLAATEYIGSTIESAITSPLTMNEWGLRIMNEGRYGIGQFGTFVFGGTGGGSAFLAEYIDEHSDDIDFTEIVPSIELSDVLTESVSIAEVAPSELSDEQSETITFTEYGIRLAGTYCGRFGAGLFGSTMAFGCGSKFIAELEDQLSESVSIAESDASELVNEYTDDISFSETQSGELGGITDETMLFSETVPTELSDEQSEDLIMNEVTGSILQTDYSESVTFIESAASALESNITESITASESIASLYDLSYSEFLTIVETAITTYYGNYVEVKLNCALPNHKPVPLNCWLNK